MMLAAEIEKHSRRPEVPPPTRHKPYVVSLVIGVNGVGKTTTIGKDRCAPPGPGG